jgi:TolB-like protein/DNA-binding winged helix-turn-helix (wHTH) protein/Tfp pilus assembly protein PilF
MSERGEGSIVFDDGFRVGEYLVYPRRLTLVKGDETVRLEPKVMAVLVHLARNAGEVVTRNEFAEEVWRGRIVSDEVLSRDISILRSLLDDDAKNPTYVVTIPRVGYRFIGPVAPLVTDAPARVESTPLPAPEPPSAMPGSIPNVPSIAVAGEDTPAEDTRGRFGRSRRPLLLGALLVVTVGVIGLGFFPSLMCCAPPTSNVAILPFESLSVGTDDEYFGDGLAEEIMHALAGVEGIRVVARTSSFAFRDARQDVRTIGERLHVGSVVEGTIRRDANRIRVTAQLVSTSTGMHVWSESYDRELSDIFEVQNEVSTAIANRLAATLAPGARLSEAPTSDLEAYQSFLRANHLLWRRGAEHLDHAVVLFKDAIARDPTFGRAYAGLAEAYTLQPNYSGSSEKAAHALALAAAERAESLGAGSGRARGVRAFLHFRSREWREAKADFEAAIAASPDDADLQQWYSQFLANVGWMEKASLAARTAVSADPLSPVANQRAGVLSLWSGNTQEAGQFFDIAAELGIQGPGLPEAYVAYLLRAGRHEEARAWLFETQKQRGQSTTWIEPTLTAILGRGPKASAASALNRAFADKRLGVRMYFGALYFLNDADRLYEAMGPITASGEPFDVELFFAAGSGDLRSDDRFLPLMKRLGLTDFWDEFGWPEQCRADGAARRCA